MAMNAKLKAAWVKALRSRRFKQTRGTLQRLAPLGSRPVGHCCLGVLCEVAGEIGYAVPFRDATGELFGAVLDRQPSILRNQLTTSQQERCASMNDEDKKSFRQIADWVVRNVKVRKARRRRPA